MVKFNQTKYIQEYNKDHYKVFKVELKKEEYNALNEYLKKHNKTKAQFLRDAMLDKKVMSTKK